MKKTSRSQADKMVYERNKILFKKKVRPLTSHGSAMVTVTSPPERTRQLTATERRPKTAVELHRKQTNVQKFVSSEVANESTSKTRLLSERSRCVVREDRDRSISFTSDSTEVLPSRVKYKTRIHSPSYSSGAVRDANRNRKRSTPSIKPSTKSSFSSTNNLVHRKAAWFSDEDSLDTPSLEISNDELGLVSDGQTQCCQERIEVAQEETEEPVQDMFQPPDLNAEESGNEYETELEDQPAGYGFAAAVKHFDSSGKRTYLKLCKQDDILPVSGLTNQFTEKEMIVRHRGLGGTGTKPLAKSLMKNVYVEKLDLSDNYIEGVGASFVAAMLVDNCYITQLDLSQNFIGVEGGYALAEMLTKNQVLRKVTLRANHFTDRVAKHFAGTLRENRTLSHLDLSHNEIGEQGGVFLGAGLALNYGLKHLDLSWNCIRGKGGVAIAQALKTNDSLTSLNISWNGISLLGCVALGKCLRRNENLKKLDLRNNRIGYLGAQRICPAISRNVCLEELKLGLNPIGDDGVEALLKAVKINKSLKFFSLENMTVSSVAYRNIQQLEESRQIIIVTGGLGGFKKPKEMPQRMAILLDFIKVNRLRLVDWFFQFDKDQSGDISKDEFKIGLKETGLKMTQKQLDMLIEYLDVDNNGKIEYSELLIGRDHTLREQRDFRMAQQKLRDMEDARARLPTIEGFEPE